MAFGASGLVPRARQLEDGVGIRGPNFDGQIYPREMPEAKSWVEQKAPKTAPGDLKVAWACPEPTILIWFDRRDVFMQYLFIQKL